MERVLKSFIKNFYEAIEKELIEFLTKLDKKEIETTQFSVEIIDYKNSSLTPVIEKIEMVASEIRVYIKSDKKNEYYLIEEIFHQFSLAVLVDKILKTTSYTKILEKFYSDVENEVIKSFTAKNITELKLEGSFETLAITELQGKFQLIEGDIKRVVLENEQIFIILEDKEKKSYRLHIIECHLTDILPAINKI